MTDLRGGVARVGMEGIASCTAMQRNARSVTVAVVRRSMMMVMMMMMTMTMTMTMTMMLMMMMMVVATRATARR